MEASGLGFGMADLQGHITYANRALCQLLGREKPEDVVGATCSKYYPADYMFRREKEILPALSRDETWQGEVLLSGQDGPLPVLQSSFLIRDRQGAPLYVASATANLAQRKRSEESLRQSHDELQAIYDGMFDGLLITDVQTKRYVKANASLCRMLGYTPSEVLSLSVHDLHPADEVPIALERIQARAEGRLRGHVQTWMLRKDGSHLYADVVGSRLTYAGRPCVVAFFRDITEQTRAEEALRQSHQHLQAVYDGMVDGFAIFDIEDFRTVQANAALCAKLGYGRLKALTAQQRHPAEAWPRLKELYDATLQGHDAPIEEMPLFRKDGRVLYFDVAVKSLLHDGRRRQLLFFHDVTERRQARLALERERRTLEHMLQAGDHERQLIAYDIHDGLTQELAGAIMQFQACQHLKTAQPDEARAAFASGMTLLGQAYSEARRLISGVRPPILDEEGAVAAINHLVNEQHLSSQTQIEVHSKVRFARLAPILENTIYRVVQEGLANACKHSQSPRVRISLLQRSDRLRIEIRDWGQGFDPKIVRENRYGLAGMRQRARLLGGKFRISSKLKEGTTLIVEVPIVPRAAQE